MRVLIAEDDPVSRKLLESLVAKWGYTVLVATEGTEAWKILQDQDPPKLAIIDWIMPGMDGLQICQQLRRLRKRSYVYVVLLTAKSRKGDVVEGLEAGADDYLSKPFDHYELKARLRAGQRIVELQQELLAAHDALREQASHDSLTGVFNRATVLEIIQRELSRSRRQSSTICLAIADIDHFKAINDNYGHLVGDAVLRDIAQRLRSNIRPYDAIGRYGGEEFLLVFPNCGLDSALNLGNRLREAVASKRFETSAGLLPVTMSVGIAAGNASVTIDLFISSADEALYRAKHRGRNCVEVATDGDVNAQTSPPANRLADPGIPSRKGSVVG